MGELTGKPIPSFPEEALTIKEQARDLISEANDLPDEKGHKLALKALKMDPDCIEAYEYLGSLEPIPETEILYYKNGIDIGRRIFARSHFKDGVGKFWMINETRPFMRCMQDYADCLAEMDKYHDSVAVFEEMIQLNPNDNQGVRDQLLLYLIKINEFNKFRKYNKIYIEDDRAFTLFNRALFAFKTEGSSPNSVGLLQNAVNSNKHVVSKLISRTISLEMPELYGIGDDDEAKYFTYFAHKIWHGTDGAIDWLKKERKDVPGKIAE